MVLLYSLLVLLGAATPPDSAAIMDAAAIAQDPMSCGISVNAEGERLDRLRRWAPGDPMCMYVSMDNAYDYAHRVLWVGNGGSPTGANVDCRGNLTADEVPCLIDVTDANFKVLRQVWVTCTTQRHCGHYGRDKGLCCHR